MSKQIDQQIVKMEFDNAKFEKNTKTTLNTLQKLKKALNFDEQTKTIKELEKAANHLTLDDVGATLDKLSEKFSVMGIAGMTVIQDLTRGFESFAKKTASALTAPLRQIQNGGWARAMKIKDAEFTMKGLNILGDKLVAIKDDIDYAVSGTAYGYEQAASAAAQFAASNVQIGDSMKTALRSISGIAAQTNSSYDEIAGIFTTIAGNGKVMTQQLRQLSFRGMNATATLAKSMHTTEAAIGEMVKKGEISFDMFAKAMDEAFGEHAKAANETFQGALDNMKASLSRVGADFASPWIDFQRDVFNSTRLILNSLRKETSAYETYASSAKRVILDGKDASERDIANTEVMRRVMNNTKLSMNANLNSMMKSYEKAKKLYDDSATIVKRLKNEGKTGTDEYAKQLYYMDKYAKDVKKAKKDLKGAYLVDTEGTKKAGNEIDKLTKKIENYEKVIGTRDAAQKRITELTKAGKTRTKDYADTLAILKKYTEEAKKLEAEPIKSEKILLNQLKGYVKDTTYYMGGAAENALDRAEEAKKKLDKYTKRTKNLREEQDKLNKDITALTERNLKTGISAEESKRLSDMSKRKHEIDKDLSKLEKRVKNTTAKLNAAEDEAYNATIVGRTNSIGRLVETYKGILANVRSEVLNFLNDPKLVMGINNVVDGLNYLLQFTSKIAQPIKNAWRSIFPDDEATIIFNITEKFKKFMQELRLSTEGSDKVESIFRGIAAALSILRTVVGDVFSAFNTIAKPAVNMLIDLFSILGEGVVTVEWRFRQFRAALLFTIGYFTKVIKNSKSFKLALSGLSAVVSVAVAAFTVLARIIGTVLIFAITSILGALDKLATNLDNILEFVTPIGKALLYVFSTVGGVVVKAIGLITKPLSLFRKETKEANKAIGQFGAGSVSPLQKFGATVTSVSEIIRDFLANGLTKLGDFIKDFSFSGLIQSGIDRVKYILNGFKEGFLSIPALLGQTMASIVSLVVKGLGTIVSGIGSFIKAFLEAKVNLETGATVLDTLKEHFGGVIEKVENFKKSFEENGTLDKFKEKLGEISDAIKGFTETITPAKLFAVVFTVAVALMTIAVFNLINSISTFMTFATQVPIALAEMLKGMKSLFTQLTARIAPVKKASTQFKEVAEAIGIIAAAIYFLGEMDPNKLRQGTNTMWEIIIALGAMMAVFKLVSLIQKKVYGPGQLAASGKAFAEMMRNLIAVSGALILVSVALNILSRANFDGTVSTLEKITIAILAIGGVYLVMAAISRLDKGVQSTAASVIAFAGSLYVMVLALERLQSMPIQNIFESLKALVACIAVLAALAIAVNTVTLTNGAGLFLALAALWIAVPLLKKLSKIDFSGLPDVLQEFIATMVKFAVIGGLINALTKHNVFAGFESFGKGMVAIASSMVLMVAAIALLGSLNKSVLKKGIMALGGLTAMVVAMEIFATHTIGNGMKQFAVGVLLITTSFVLMTGLVAVLGSLDVPTLFKGVVAIGAMTGMIIAFMWASKLIKKIDWSTTALFIGLSIDILALTGALVVLAQVPWQQLLSATIAMGATLLAFGKACEMIFSAGKNFRGGKAKTILFIGMALVIAELAGILYVLSKCPWQGMLASGFAMSACLMAFAGGMAILSKTLKGLPTKVGPMLVAFLGMLGAVAAIGTALWFLSQQPWDRMIASGIAMSMCLLVFAGAFSIIAASNMFNSWSSIGKMAVEFALLCVVMVGISHVLGELATHDWKSILASAGSIALVFITMAGVISVMTFIPITAGVKAAIGIIAFVGILALLMYAIDKIFSSDGKSGTDKLADQIRKLGNVFGAFVDGFVTGATEHFAEAGKRLSDFATNAKDFFDLVKTFKDADSATGLNSMIDLFAALTKAEFLDGLNVFGHIHEYIKGEDQSAELGNDLVNLAKVMKEFQNEVSGVDADELTKQAEALGKLLEAISYIPAPTTSTTADGYALSSTIDYETFGSQVVKLGDALVDFQKHTKKLKTESIEKASTAMQMINAFCAEIPNSGSTVLKWIIGDNEVGDFADGIEKLGPALLRFSMASKFVEPKAVEGASHCMGIIAAFSENIPKSGGWAQVFKGTPDLEAFANALPGLGSKFKEFAGNVTGITTDDAVKVAYALKDLADAGKVASEQGIESFKLFAESLPAASGSIKSFFAELEEGDVYDTSKVSTFGSNVRALARIAEDIAGSQYTAFLDLADSISTLAKTGLDVTAADAMEAFKTSMDATIADINEKEEEFIAAGRTTIDNFVSGMEERVETVKSKATKVCILAKGAMEKYYDIFFNCGKYSAENYARGLEGSSAQRRVKAAAQTLSELASSGTVPTSTTESAMSDISTNIVNTLVGINDQATNFSSAADSLMSNFIGGLDAGITAIKDYGSKITGPVLNHLVANDTLKKFKDAGSNSTDRFGDGIKSTQSVKYVKEQATSLGLIAVAALDKAIADPVGVSDETLKLGNAFANGFGIGIKSSTKMALKSAAEMGAETIKTLKETTHDPTIFGIEISLDSFNMGKAFGAGYAKGIEIFNNAVGKAAEVLGLKGISGLDDVLTNMEGKIKEKEDSLLGGLWKAITGEDRKEKTNEDVESLFGKFFDDLDKKLENTTENANDMNAAIDNAKKTKGKKGKKGSSKEKWKNSDLVQAMSDWLAITNDFTVKYDAYNSKLINKGKITVKYLAQSVGQSKKLKDLLEKAKAEEKIINNKKSTKKQIKEAKKELAKYQKEIKKEQDKGNDLRKAVMAFKDSDIADINKKIKDQAKSKGIKEGTKAYAKLAKDITKKRVKEINAAYEAMQNEFKGIVNDKKLLNTLTGVPTAVKAYVKNYKTSFTSVKGINKKYKEIMGIKSDKKADKAMQNFGEYLYKRSDEYKTATKQLNKDLKKQAELEKKANKERKIINDPKKTDAQKLAAKKRLATYKSQSKDIQKEIAKLVKEIETGPNKAVKKLKKEVKSAAKEFLAFSNINFDRVLSAFDLKTKSTNLQSQSYDIFTASVVSATEAAKQATDSFGLLNISVETGTNLLERFEKVGTKSARRLMKNAQSQVKAYEEFRNGIERLREMKLDDSIIEQLEAQGVQSLSYIRGFLNMSTSEIASYNAIVAKDNANKAKATEKAMEDTATKYKKHATNLQTLEKKLSIIPEETRERMMKEIKAQGIGAYDFVETLLYMDNDSLKHVSSMYSDSLANAVDQAVKNVDLSNEGKTFLEKVEESVTKYEDQQNKLAELKTLGVSELLIEKLKGMGYTEFQAYYEEFINYSKEQVEYLNTQYEKSLYDGKSAAATWADNMAKSTDTYNGFNKNMKKIAKLLPNGKKNPLYQQLEEMGWEAGAEYAEAFVKASDDERQTILAEFDRQKQANDAAITQSLKDRMAKLKQWRDDLKALSKAGISAELMGTLVEAGPDNYQEVHILATMDPEERKKFDNEWVEATKLPDKIPNTVIASYEKVVNDAITAASKTAKSKDNKDKVTKSVNHTVKAAAKAAKPTAKKSGEEVGEQTGKGVAKGMGNVSSLVKEAAEKLATKAYKAMKNKLNIKSPSKVTEELGKYFDFGFIQGILKYQNQVENTSSELANSLTNQIYESANSINDAFGTSTLEPVVHPTLDLSDIVNDAYALSARMDVARNIIVTLDDKANKDVVGAIGSMQEDFNNRIEELSQAMNNMQIYLDSGTLVGELAAPMDNAMGRMMANRRRGM